MNQVPPGVDPSVDPKAAAKAAQAYAKATRPWYKKKRWWLLGAIALIVIIVAATSSGGDDGPKVVDDTSQSSSDNQKSDNKKSDDAPKVGTKSNPLALGKTVELAGTRYTVNSAETKDSIGSDILGETADGTFVVVSLTIENRKSETKTFTSSSAKFVASSGDEYDTDSEGSIAATTGDGDPLIFEEMQPKLPKTGLLVFDVPKNAVSDGLLKVSDLFGKGDAYIDLALQ